MRNTALLTVLALVGCGTSEQGGDETTAPREAPAALPAAAMPQPTDADSLAALTPSPREVIAAMKAAGLTVAISDLVPDRELSTAGMSNNLAAVWTGVLAADAILTGADSGQDEFVQRLKAVESGMGQLGAGAGLMATLTDAITRVENGTASREDFLREFEEVLAMKVPGEGWGPEDDSGILVQAGSWLAGVNLVSKAIVVAQKEGAAQVLLRHGSVVDHFLHYVRVEGPDSAPKSGLETLNQSLLEMGVITRKTELLTLADAERIHALTEAVFASLVGEVPTEPSSGE